MKVIALFKTLHLQYAEFETIFSLPRGYTKRQKKARTGENPRDIRPVKPRMYENESKERCPVQLYKAFAQRRPEDCNNADCTMSRKETRHKLD